VYLYSPSLKSKGGGSFSRCVKWCVKLIFVILTLWPGVFDVFLNALVAMLITSKITHKMSFGCWRCFMVAEVVEEDFEKVLKKVLKIYKEKH